MTFILLLKRFWWAPILSGLLFYAFCLRLTVAHQEASIVRYGGVMKMSIERIGRARAEALASDLAHARAEETRQAKTTWEIENAVLSAREGDRVDAIRHAARLRAATAQGGSSVADMPYAAQPSTVADAAGSETELDALRCADAVIKAEGWQTFWTKAFGGSE